MFIYCCGCGLDVGARLTDGSEIYPHRPDLATLPFWKCDNCGNHVGCHHRTRDRTRPLGNIPTPELREARKHIHRLLDPLWESGKMTRKEVYQTLKEKLGYAYHTAEISSVEEARKVYRILKTLSRS